MRRRRRTAWRPAVPSRPIAAAGAVGRRRRQAGWLAVLAAAGALWLLGSHPAVQAQSPPTLSIAGDACVLEPSTGEGNATMTFTVTLSAESASDVVFWAETKTHSRSDAATSVQGVEADFEALSEQTTIPAGNIAATVDVTVYSDHPQKQNPVEGDETFTIEVRPASAGVQGTSTAAGKITETDPAITIAAAASTAEGASGTTTELSLSVSLSEASPCDVAVDYATSDGTAAAGADYTDTSGTVTIDADDTSGSIVVEVLGDTADEPDETFTVALSDPANGSLGTASSATVTITDDDDPPTVSVADGAGAEGGDVEFTAELSAVSGHIVTVDWTASAEPGDTAVPGDDFTTASGMLTFAAGTTSQTFTVAAADDTVDEPDETFTVTLDNPANATLSSTAASATGTITDTDGEPTLDVTAPSAVTEGNSGSKLMTFTVTLAPASAKTVTVNWSTNDLSGADAASAGQDYTSAAGSLTFASGQTTKQVSVTVLGDELDEEDPERFGVSLAGAVNARLTGGTPAVGLISDDDDPPVLSVEDAASLAETGIITFTVSLVPVSGRTVTVKYATSSGTGGDAATEGTDFVRAAGTLTFAPSVTAATFGVRVLADNVTENDETFTVTLSDAAGATLSSTKNTATGTITTDDADPQISIAGPAAAVLETDAAQDVTFTVTLSAVSTDVVTVNYATVAGTATAGDDFTATSGTIAFAASASVTVATFTVSVAGDTADEHDETFTVVLSDASNAGFASDTVTVTITDDDDPPDLSIADVTLGETEADQDMTFTVELSPASGKQVTVNYATTAGTAADGDDFTAVSGTLTFAPGTTSQTFAVTVAGDALDEDDETFTVTLSGAVNAGVPDSTATGTVSDNDVLPGLSVVSVSAPENSDISFTVTLSPVSGRQVTVRYATAAGTAAAGADFTTVSGTLTFAPGVTSQTFAVAVADDALDENDETFTVKLSHPDDATLANTTATGTITDNDDPPTVSITGGSVVEPDGSNTDTITFTVSLSTVTTKTVTVRYATAAGTAAAGVDFTTVSGTLTFATGTTVKTLAVAVAGDDIDEADETFTVGLSTPTNATLTSTTAATGTIIDNEGSARLSINDAGVEEGDSGSKTMRFTVELLGVTAQTVTARWVTSDGTATAGADYTSSSGTLTFTSGAMSSTFDVAVLGDGIDEADETFTVTLDNAANATLADATATGTITDNDPLPRVSVHRFVVDPLGDGTDYHASGVEGGPVRFPVTLSAPSGRTVVVNYRTVASSRLPAAKSSAAATSVEPEFDYTEPAADAAFTFAPGETFGQIDVATSDDSISNGSRYVDLVLSLPPSPVASIRTARAIGTIEDDEPVPAVSVSSAIAAENAGTISFTVELNIESNGRNTVQWQASAAEDDTATEEADFAAGGGEVVFEPGDTSKTITVAIADDAADELDETFTVTLSGVSGRAGLDQAEATGTITDNDDPPAVSVAAASAAENSPTMQFTVMLAAVSGRTVTVAYQTADGTATAGDDYTSSSGVLTFDPGDTSKTFAVALTDDQVAETDETIVVTVSSPDGSAVDTGPGARGEGAVVDDDGPARLSVADVTVSEDSGSAAFTVTLTPESGFTVTVNYATADGTATAGDDYTGASGVLTFDPGETSKQIDVTVTDDSVHEDLETFTLTLSGQTGDTAVRIARSAATAAINDDDREPQIEIVDAGTVVEGHDGDRSNMTFQVTLTGTASSEVTVDFETRGGTATAGSDYEARQGSLSFAPAEAGTPKPVTVIVRGDDEREGDETVVVRLFNAQMGGATVLIVPAEATGTIRDDEPGVLVAPQSLNIDEGGQATYEVQLYTQPAGAVTIAVGSDNADVTAVPASLTFTTADYSTAQTVTVSALHDDDSADDRAGLTHTVTGYGAVTEGPTLAVTVDDDEVSVRPIGPIGLGPIGPVDDDPEDRAPSAAFVDVAPRSVHAVAIGALLAEGITGGCSVDPPRYCPQDPVTRAQMASLLARALDLPGRQRTSAFVDVAPRSVHAVAIGALLAEGITGGCSVDPPRYCPQDPVTRAQMASLLARALDLPERRQLVRFVDVAAVNVHASAVSALFAVGITGGCSTDPLRYCPQDPVTRAQMASFLARALDLS